MGLARAQGVHTYISPWAAIIHTFSSNGHTHIPFACASKSAQSRAAVAPRRLPSRSRRTECASVKSQLVRRPVCASESSEFERECAQLRGTNPLPQRYVTHEVLSGKCRLGQGKGMSVGQGLAGNDMTN